MSKMKDLSYDIEQLYIEGLNPVQIAQELDCSKELVIAWIVDQGITPFDEWSLAAKQRLIQDLGIDESYSPFATVNS